jgi:uncharacterized membrane protein
MSSTTSTWEQASVAGPATADPAKAMARTRLQSIDALRGFVMVVMLLDHVRENWFLYMQVSDPVDALTTAPSLFFTRLTSTLCARSSASTASCGSGSGTSRCWCHCISRLPGIRA